MGFMMFLFSLTNVMLLLPYVFYGPGEDALSLTKEFGAQFHLNATQSVAEDVQMKELCYAESNSTCPACYSLN